MCEYSWHATTLYSTKCNAFGFVSSLQRASNGGVVQDRRLPPEAAWQGLDAACYSKILQVTKVALHMDRHTDMPVLKLCMIMLTFTARQKDVWWQLSKS